MTKPVLTYEARALFSYVITDTVVKFRLGVAEGVKTMEGLRLWPFPYC